MKKLVLTMLALVTGATLGYSQGAIILNTTSGLVTTNGSSISEGTGLASGNAQYFYEVLDMTSNSYAGLTVGQQASLTNLSTSLSLWTDAVVGGNNVSLHAGGIAGAAAAAGNTAANWAEPTPNTSYNTASTYDYYVIVGWSVNEGNNWLSVSNELANNSWSVTGAGSWFGVSQVAYNFAGVPGGAPGAPSVWGASATGLAGSGGLTGLVLTPVTAAPEPTTLALAGLGGLSLMLFRRRKS